MERLFTVNQKQRRTLAGNLPVPVDKAACPACGGPTALLEHIEQAMFIHGGYGANRATRTRHCARFCGWGLTEAVSETNPRR